MRLTDPKLLLSLLHCPDKLTRLPHHELDRVLRYAECSRILSSLGRRCSAAAIAERLPRAARDRIISSSMWAEEQARALRWEAYFVRNILIKKNISVVILKGGAYLLGGFANADGRLVSDLDLMVPAELLKDAEHALLSAGYEYQKADDYDQAYYREWMHELPPLVNPHRGLIVDLHHNVAPPVSRLKISAERLFERAVPLDRGFLRLGDEDLVLHLCVHMFHDGELNNALRELLDLDGLLRAFGTEDAYWDRLLERANDLGIKRPLYYGVTCCCQLLGTPVPERTLSALRRFGPVWPAPVLAIMRRGIMPDTFDQRSLWRSVSVNLLYWRSHWLRMPPAMLVKHLWTQMLRRGGLKRGEQVSPHG